VSNQTITGPLGFKAAGVACGIKASGKPDLGLLICDVPAAVAGCFTQNRTKAAPVEISREHIKNGYSRGVVVNSGNANACTGSQGLTDAQAMTQKVASHFKISQRDILVASTGIIGRFLDMEKINQGIDETVGKLNNDEASGMDFLHAIMTTDTKLKQSYREFEVNGKVIKIAGVAKGSGMICPNMATMLSFITTDAKLSPTELRNHLAQAVGRSFNRITVDGDMSTNDSVMLFASGLACTENLGQVWQSEFGENLYEVCNELALAVVDDGEGATKVFHVMVTGASSYTQAHKIARQIAQSPLVKTAIHGGDPNWGRIICSAGAASVPFNPQTAICSIGDIVVFKHGLGENADLDRLETIMKQKDIWITLDLGDGDASDVVHSCDLSKGYVDINAFYHT
jgi:glutamate N-acetyltransferase/amino-acid N-acetyltransferase